MPKKIIINTLKYLKEISIVMLGLTISFSINTCINNRNDRRDISLYLQTIDRAMDDVIKMIENRLPISERALELRTYLLMTERDLWVQDKIFEFNEVIFSGTLTSFNLESFEMLLSSGMIRLISDIDLQMMIFNTKGIIETTNRSLEKSFDVKTPLLHEFIRTEDLTPLLEHYRNNISNELINILLKDVLSQAETLKQKLSESRYMK